MKQNRTALMKPWHSTFFLIMIITSLLFGALNTAPYGLNAYAAETEQSSLFDSSADIIILHTNDTHGYVKADDEKNVIGFDTIAAVKQSVPEKSLLLDAGDMSNGLPFAAKSKGLAPIEVMNAVGYDAATIGNHEFDMLDDNVKKIIAEANFPILSANIRYEADGSYLANPNHIFTVSGVKIGVFGLTTTEAAVNPITAKGFDFGTTESILADAASQAEELRNAGCDIVILLSHLGIEPEHSDITSIQVAEALGGKLDLIIDGHSHTSPKLNSVVNGVPVLSTGGEADSNIGWVTFNKKDDGKLEPKYGYIDYKTARDNFSPMPEITALINELNKPVEAMATNTVAVVNSDLNGERADIRTGETNLGNTLADAAVAFTGADASMMNSGAMRASLKKGELSELDINTAFPYGDSIYMSLVKGSVILEALEHACSEYPAPEGVFAQVSGISYTFDPKRPPGNRVVSVEINGKPMDTNASYKLATNDFWAIGGNGYTMFSEPFKTPYDYERPQSSIFVSDVFVWYLNQTGGAVSDVGGRINIAENFAAKPPVQDTTGNWYDESILYVHETGIMGDADKPPLPDLPVTQETAFDAMFNMLGKPAADTEKWLAETGLLAGGAYDANKTITRAELISYFSALLDYQSIEYSPADITGFKDSADVSDWSAEAFRNTVGAGLVYGGDGKLMPKKTANQAELAQILYNFASQYTVIEGTFTAINKYGFSTTNINISRLTAAGIEYGDILAVKAGDFEFEVPFGTNTSDVDIGDTLAVDMGEPHNIVLATNMGDFAKAYGISVGASVSLSLSKKGGYKHEYELRQLSRTNVREDYSSDEVFANFRPIAVGGVANGILYRASSPANNYYGRAKYADMLSERAGIESIVDLADSPKLIEQYFASKDFSSYFFKKLYGNGRVKCLDMGIDLRSEVFRSKLKDGLIFIAENDGPYLLHCNEGKDRTGFIAALLEALMGAEVDEIAEDYMLSYVNFYHMEAGSEQYNVIMEGTIMKSLRIIAGIDEDTELRDIDLAAAAEEYAIGLGLTPEQVIRIKENLSGTQLNQAEAHAQMSTYEPAA